MKTQKTVRVIIEEADCAALIERAVKAAEQSAGLTASAKVTQLFTKSNFDCARVSCPPMGEPAKLEIHMELLIETPV